MQTEILIIGQGICGTMLSYFLQKEGKDFLVLDDERPYTATAAAAGIINPVTGRRYVYTWMIDTVMPFAVDTYRQMGEALQVAAVQQRSIIDFFPTAQMRDAFVTRLTEDDTFLHSFPDQNHFNQYFHYDFGCGEIRPAYSVSFGLLIAAWRQYLLQQNRLLAETFDAAALEVKRDGIQYKNITAEKIIFCDGIESARNPWFSRLPFSPNKGEALLIHSPELTTQYIFKKGLMLAPLPVQHTFWAGSNYQWEFENEQPSEGFYTTAKTQLQHWLQVPFEIVAHKAAVRPATLERRPFVGLHPHLPALGILNGMGTKGSSLAPYFAHQFAQYLVHRLPIAEEADVARFSRILAK
jgi:glycine/D-amino acid oxidase-like deaminating enzyme